MENTISDAVKNRIPSVEEEEFIHQAMTGALSVFMGTPVVADTDRIVTTVLFANGTLSIAAQPDCPRNVTATLTDADDSVVGTLTITGKDPMGRTIVEVMSPDGEGAGKTLTGTKIFAKIDSVMISGASGGEADVDMLVVGVGTVIGLPVDLPADDGVRHVFLGGARQATPTVAIGISTSGIDASAGTYNGAKVLHAFVQPIARV
jgi:hypothetical protein